MIKDDELVVFFCLLDYVCDQAECGFLFLYKRIRDLVIKLVDEYDYIVIVHESRQKKTVSMYEPKVGFVNTWLLWKVISPSNHQ